MKFATALVTALATLVLLWAIGWIWFCANVVVMENNKTSIKTDSIIVLTGGKNRIEEGIRLLKAGEAEKLFISGVNEQVKKEDLIKTRPIPCCITLGYEAFNTEGNANESAQWIKDNKIKSIHLVTSNYHMPRARLFFERVTPNLTIIPHPVKPDNFDPLKAKFWSTTFGEYNKTIATWIKLSVEREGRT